MKKYITVAALLAAGTAFANALSITEDTTMTPGGNYFAGAFDFSFKIAEDLSFKSESEYLLGYYGTANASGNYSGNVFTLKGDAEGNLTLFLDRVASLTLEDGDIKSVGTIHNSSVFSTQVASTDGTTTTAYELSAGVLYTVKYLGGDNNSAAADLYLGGVKVASFTGGSHNMNGGGDGTTSLTVYVNSTYVVPEPSAFGMLAGLGALALVASRRRRK